MQRETVGNMLGYVCGCPAYEYPGQDGCMCVFLQKYCHTGYVRKKEGCLALVGGGGCKGQRGGINMYYSDMYSTVYSRGIYSLRQAVHHHFHNVLH
jgi:hypothetical protein